MISPEDLARVHQHQQQRAIMAAMQQNAFIPSGSGLYGQGQQGMANSYLTCANPSEFVGSTRWVGNPSTARTETAPAYKPQQDKPKGKGVFSQISNDVKTFIIEHRSIIYFVAAAILIDHFLFKGAFRERLQSVADRLVKRVEDKVSEVTK